MPATRRDTPCVLLAEEVWGSGLQAVRSLGRAGVPVYVATAGSGSGIYGRSRWCTGTTDIEVTDAGSFVDGLLEWLDGHQFRRSSAEHPIPIIPLSDRLVEFLVGNEGRFDGRFRISIADADVSAALLDKVSSFRLAQAAGLDVPPFADIQAMADLDETHGLTYPIAIRPTSWSTAGSEYFKVAVAHTPEEFRSIASTALSKGAHLIAQNYITARDEDVELAITWTNREGSQSVVCTGRKRRQSSPDGGVMVWGEAVDLPDIRELAEKFLATTGYAGLGGLEFIRSNGTPWFIEFNPRAEAIHFLASKAGLDTILMEYDELTGRTVQIPDYSQGPATAWIGSAWLARLMSDRDGWKASLTDRLNFARSPARIRAVWTLSDPLPGLALTSRIANRGLASLRRSHRGMP